MTFRGRSELLLLALVALSLNCTAFGDARGKDQAGGNTSADCCGPAASKQSEHRDSVQREQTEATALVANVEPLLLPAFERTHGPTIEEFGESTWISFNYQVRSGDLRGQKLVDEIKRLFKVKGWSDGLPPDHSVGSRNRDGSQRTVLGFHKEPLLRTSQGLPYTHRWASVVIADDGTSLQCTYSFPSPERPAELAAVAYYSPKPEFHADGDRVLSLLKAHEIFAISAESASITVSVPGKQAPEARKLISEAIAKERLRVTIIP